MRYRNLLAAYLGLALLLCTVTGTEANPAPPNEGRGDSPFRSEKPEPPGKNDSEKREQVAKRVETMLMWRLTDVLNLNEQQGAKVFPIIKKYEKEVRQTAEARHKVRQDLRRAIKENKTEEIKRLLNEFTSLDDKIHKIHTSEFTDLKGVLSITQLAEYALSREEFDREVREMIFDARHRGNRHRRWEDDNGGYGEGGHGGNHRHYQDDDKGPSSDDKGHPPMEN